MHVNLQYILSVVLLFFGGDLLTLLIITFIY
jgi:hypothetical protein